MELLFCNFAQSACQGLLWVSEFGDACVRVLWLWELFIIHPICAQLLQEHHFASATASNHRCSFSLMSVCMTQCTAYQYHLAQGKAATSWQRKPRDLRQNHRWWKSGRNLSLCCAGCDGCHAFDVLQYCTCPGRNTTMPRIWGTESSADVTPMARTSLLLENSWPRSPSSFLLIVFANLFYFQLEPILASCLFLVSNKLLVLKSVCALHTRNSDEFLICTVACSQENWFWKKKDRELPRRQRWKFFAVFVRAQKKQIQRWTICSFTLLFCRVETLLQNVFVMVKHVISACSSRCEVALEV